MDSIEAKVMFERAVELANTGRLVEAITIYKSLAETGHVMAQYRLGLCYFHGSGIMRDPAKAFEYYHKAADQGYVDAQLNLGYCYSNGIGIAQDYEKAFEWYHKAAEQGNAGAMNNIGIFYKHGRGVTQDYGEAEEWYRKAAENGSKDALENLEILKEEQNPSPSTDAAIENIKGIARIPWAIVFGFFGGIGIAFIVDWIVKQINEGTGLPALVFGFALMVTGISISIMWINKKTRLTVIIFIFSVSGYLSQLGIIPEYISTPRLIPSEMDGKTATVADNISLHASPSNSSNNVIKSVNSGETIVVIGITKKGWAYVEYGENTGYTKAEYLKAEE